MGGGGEKIQLGGILGCLGRPTPPPGDRAGSENDTLLPMTRDRPKVWNSACAECAECTRMAWRSKVIIRKPWRRKNTFFFLQNHKAFPAGKALLCAQRWWPKTRSCPLSVFIWSRKYDWVYQICIQSRYNMIYTMNYHHIPLCIECKLNI